MNPPAKMKSDVKVSFLALPALMILLCGILGPLPLEAQPLEDFCRGAGGKSPATPVPERVASSPCCSSEISTCDINFPNCACITSECNKPGAPGCCLTNSCGPEICDDPCTPPLVGTDINLCESGGGAGISMWPADFRPASEIPLKRDTTQREAGKGIPGAGSGFELFKSLDIVTVNGISRRLYVAYNAGIQAWNIENDPALSINDNPAAFRDGWQGHFNTFPPPSEQLNFVEDIAAMNEGSLDVIAVAGKFEVGVTIWTFNPTTMSFTQKYQDLGTEALQVRMVEHNNRLYVFATHAFGVEVYDASAAADLGSICETDKDAGACPQVYLGSIAGINFSGYIDVITASGKIYVATTAGHSQIPLEIWQLNSALNYATPLRVFSGVSPNTKGAPEPAMFEANGKYYMAYLIDHKLKVLLIDDCLNGTGINCLPPLVVDAPNAISTSSFVNAAQFEFLSFSEGSGTPFLYYGVALNNLDGPNLDQLFDLSTLPTSGAGSPLITLPEVTASGGSYTDPCNGSQIRYWSHYYSLNTHGLRNMHPRVGKMAANGYFYRVAQSILDVHKYGGIDTSPIITVNTTNPAQAPWWMNQSITFQATASPAASCNGAWNWDVVGEGGDPPDIDDVAAISFPICGSGSQCSPTVHTIQATNGGCGDATVIGKTVTTQDPRPFIDGVDILPASANNTYDVGSQLTFVADVDGRDDGSVPMTHAWEVFKQGNAVPLITGGGNFALDTCNSLFSELVFEDGFESGTTSRWFTALGEVSKRSMVASVPQIAKGTSSDTYTVKLTSSNSTGSDSDQSTTFILEGAGPLAMGSLTASPTVQSSEAGVTLTVDSNATEFRWEVEDAAGSCVDAGNCNTVCNHYSQCTVFDWGREDNQIPFVWLDPNVVGTRRVMVEGRKCSEPALSAELTVTVNTIPTTVIPVVLTLKIVSDDLSATADPSKPCVINPIAGTVKCRVGDEVEFEVVTDSDPVTDYTFDYLGTGSFGSFTPSTKHTYTSVNTGGFTPAVKARKGTGVSVTAVVLKHFTTTLTMTIENF